MEQRPSEYDHHRDVPHYEPHELFRSPRIRCVSQNIKKYRFVDNCWEFYVSKCILSCSKRERMLQVDKEMKFLFKLHDDEFPDKQCLSKPGRGLKEDAFVFGVYAVKQKVSHAKRYKVVCDKGGYIEIDGTCTFFEHGTFEFLFLVKGPDDEYPKSNYINKYAL